MKIALILLRESMFLLVLVTWCIPVFAHCLFSVRQLDGRASPLALAIGWQMKCSIKQHSTLSSLQTR